jgi:hypothetical protein
VRLAASEVQQQLVEQIVKLSYMDRRAEAEAGAVR